MNKITGTSLNKARKYLCILVDNKTQFLCSSIQKDSKSKTNCARELSRPAFWLECVALTVRELRNATMPMYLAPNQKISIKRTY